MDYGDHNVGVTDSAASASPRARQPGRTCSSTSRRPAVLAELEHADNELPMALRDTLAALLATIAAAEQDMRTIEERLQAFADTDLRSQRLPCVGGIGPITATALSASVGAFERFPSSRHFASSLGLTPREHSSGKLKLAWVRWRTFDHLQTEHAALLRDALTSAAARFGINREAFG